MMYHHPALVLLIILISNTGCLAQGGTNGVQYSIETRVIVDKFAISSWNHTVHSILHYANVTDQPRAFITDFIKALFVGVNGIYAGLTSSGIKIDVRIASIEFITDESVVTETSHGSGFVNKGTIIDQLQLWLVTKSYPRADHTMLLTGLKMTNTTFDTSNTGKDPIGQASLGAMCGSRSLSAVQNIPNGQTVITIAHELGHSLNASHDGEENSCSGSTKNVMRESVPMNTSTAYHFSSCSISYFKAMLQALSHDRNGNCLTQTTAPAVEGVPLGRLFTPDQFCQMTGGTELARVCRFIYGYNTKLQYDSTCGAMWCSIGSNDNSCDDVYGADGLTCGNHKDCYQGVCVQSATAPASSESCPFGDSPSFPEKSVFIDSNETCAELVYDCYSDNVRRSCCATCEKAYTGTKGCEYGDKHVNCVRLTYPSACYWDPNPGVCCASCARYYNPQHVGCEYGDKAHFCSTIKMEYPYDCGSNADDCCASCQQYYNASRVGCEYGDKHRDCAQLPYPRACYTDPNADVCCGSCYPYYDATRVGCEYGDKHPTCATLDYPDTCRVDTNGDICCASCYPYRNQHQLGCEYGDKNPGCREFISADPSRCRSLHDTCCLTCANSTYLPTSDPLIG